MQNRSLHLYMFVTLIFGLMILIRVLPAGFHQDSLVYMSMARNLAEGEYSFWNLHFSNTFFDHFYEHPPLGIYIYSLFFSLFGDTILIDKFFGSFFTLVLLLEIALIYKQVAPENPRNGILLSFFYFLTFSMSGYTVESNLLELPAAFFTLGAVYVFLKSVQSNKYLVLYPFVFALVLLGAFLVKGPVTLFPFALPFFYFLLFKYSFKQAAVFYIFTIVFSLIFAAALYSYVPAKEYMTQYFMHQVVASVSGSRGGDEHFKLTLQILLDFGASFLISTIAIFAAHKKVLKPHASKMFWLFLLIGLSASLPLEVSPRQHNYYLFPSLPFFAIALALLFTDQLSASIKRFGSYKFVIVLNMILLVVFLGVSWQKLHDYRRHKNFQKDFIEAHVKLPRGAVINICATSAQDQHEFFHNTEITAGLQRYYRAKLYENNSSAPYFLTTKASLEKCKVDPENYQYIGQKDPQYYLLYRKN